MSTHCQSRVYARQVDIHRVMYSRLTAAWSQPTHVPNPPPNGEEEDHNEFYRSFRLPGQFPDDDGPWEWSAAECPAREIYELPDADTSARFATFPSDDHCDEQHYSAVPASQGPYADDVESPVPTLSNKAGPLPESSNDSPSIVELDSRSRPSQPVVTPSSPIVIAVFGLTGTGKSSFIAKLTGKEVKVGHGLHSCTSDVEEATCKIDGYNVTLVDTPGFDDTDNSDADTLQLIASWMMKTYSHDVRLTGVIYLHRISDIRMTQTSLKNLRMMRKLCGTSNLSHVILATTMWDKVGEEEGTRRERELLSEGKWWGDMKHNGAIVRRYDNSQVGATALVSELLGSSPIVLKIQREIAIEEKSLLETAAGQLVNEMLSAISKKYEEELAVVKVEMEEAISQNNDEWKRHLDTMHEKLKAKVKETERSKKILREPINKRAWWQRSWRCKGCGVRLTKGPGPAEKEACPGCGFIQWCV